MSKNESVDFFLRFLEERFTAFRTALTSLIQAVTQEDRTRKLEEAKLTLARIDDLKRAMSKVDHPNWIRPLEERISWYVRAAESQQDAGLQLIGTVLQLNPQIESQKWEFADTAASSAIDFAQIYQEYYQASKVPELFDQLVCHLETIINSGEIDSVQTTKALERLLATIRKNARGDYFSTRGAWEFTLVFFKNLSIETLETIPALKQVSKALRKTMAELDLEMSHVHDEVRKRLQVAVPGLLPVLEYRTRTLPAPKSNEDEDATLTSESKITTISDSHPPIKH
jgi:hypothetical protein